jgi:hypothetical protein
VARLRGGVFLTLRPVPTPVADPGPFEGIEGRRSVDYLLRNSQQQLVALGGQADFKASVMITASAIVASVGAAQLGDDALRWPAVGLLLFIVGALLASVLAVYPKFPRHLGTSEELPPGFNVLFFGHYAGIDKDRYLEEMAAIARDDGAIYRAIANDLYDQGVYLVQAKYRYLRVSYTLFLLGFMLAAVTLVVTSIID